MLSMRSRLGVCLGSSWLETAGWGLGTSGGGGQQAISSGDLGSGTGGGGGMVLVGSGSWLIISSTSSFGMKAKEGSFMVLKEKAINLYQEGFVGSIGF